MRSWHALAVLLPRPGVAAVSRALVALGALGLQEDLPPGTNARYRQPWDRGPAPRLPRMVLLRAWFDARPPEDELAKALGAWPASAPEWAIQGEEDWAEDWKRHFSPVRISERLIVAAPWHAIPGALVIVPGNAFGTGEHTTTRACLHAIDRYAAAHPGPTRLLDVGCGSGILALAGARLGMDARGVDIDPDAVTAAREAARLNALPATFDTADIAEIEGGWDLVVANLYAEVLAELAPQILRVSRGVIALSGILADRADLVRAAFAERRVLRDDTADGWTAIELGPP